MASYRACCCHHTSYVADQGSPSNVASSLTGAASLLPLAASSRCLARASFRAAALARDAARMSLAPRDAAAGSKGLYPGRKRVVSASSSLRFRGLGDVGGGGSGFFQSSGVGAGSSSSVLRRPAHHDVSVCCWIGGSGTSIICELIPGGCPGGGGTSISCAFMPWGGPGTSWNWKGPAGKEAGGGAGTSHHLGGGGGTSHSALGSERRRYRSSNLSRSSSPQLLRLSCSASQALHILWCASGAPRDSRALFF